MPVGGYSLGRDVVVDVNLPSGPVRFSTVTGFESKPITTEISSKALSGTDFYGTIPSGWEGSIDIDRSDANMDIAWDALEQLYYSGANVPGSTITETISEPSGGVTQWRYTNVAFKFDDHGSWKGDAKVEQKLSWKASRRIRVV